MIESIEVAILGAIIILMMIQPWAVSVITKMGALVNRVRNKKDVAFQQQKTAPPPWERVGVNDSEVLPAVPAEITFQQQAEPPVVFEKPATYHDSEELLYYDFEEIDSHDFEDLEPYYA